MEVDIYDFDKTLVPMDSGSTFAVFCFLHYPHLLLLIPYYLILAILFGLRIIRLDKFKKHIFFFIRFINVDKAVCRFWNKYEKTVYDWFKTTKSERPAVVISASPDFLLNEIKERLDIPYLICTKHNKKTGTLLNKNCRNNEKVRRFNEIFDKDTKVIRVFSDSLKNDQPIFSLGKKCFHVHKNGSLKEFSYKDMY